MNRAEKKENKALSTTGADPLFPKEGEQLESHIKKLMKRNEKKIIELLEKEGSQKQITKLSVKDVIDSLKSLMVFEGIKEINDNVVKEVFEKGWDKSEKQLNRNLEMNREAIQVLRDHTFSNIKGMTEEIVNDLKQELERGFINAESISKLKDRVRKVFDVGENRAEMIARTETNRAENQGQLLAMKKSGEKMTKTWLAVIDHRTSAICKKLNGQTVGLNEKFVDSTTKQEFEAPPSHVDCRSTLVFNIEE